MPISRIGAITPSSATAAASPILSSLFANILTRRPAVLHIHQVVAHNPELLRAQAQYAAALRENSAISRPLQELLIIRIAQINGSSYEQSVHRPIAIQLGVPTDRVDGVAGWKGNRKLFGEEAQRAALAYVEEAAGEGTVADATFAELERHYSKQAIVDLSALVGWYVGNTRFTRALQITDEGVE
ncbi:hypothetical protein SCUCBS95973_008371 [Sporothrix curviconia]|uniref:Carboxymuconolactone decarboxylase-like domain-containing protein n=1 Tax=Sporothrix curviconia TaxID=1260050 RepID=A0ABP0CNX2_9PEZI